MDYRKLNDISFKETYPLPLIYDLSGADYFETSMDVNNGFWQVRLDPM
jgi:hypothetical protein